jgi:hypothetical protein
LQASQGPAQGVSQQVASTQWLLVHSSARLQLAPLGDVGTQAPPWQK